MLMRQAAKDAKQTLSDAVTAYNKLHEQVQEASMSLYELRKQSAHVLVMRAQTLVNCIADHPKQFDRTFSEFAVELVKFNEAEAKISARYESATVLGASGAAAGVAAGATTALLGPSAAVAVATTFGTASTGTAISTLTGAAASNAVLAWLGGGALSAGGGGMVAGKALLALAGPVGWGLAGLAIAGGVGYNLFSNSRVVKEAGEQVVAVRRAHGIIDEARSAIGNLLDRTCVHAAGLRELLLTLESGLPASYRDFSEAQLQSVGALVNHVRSLGMLLNETLESLAEKASAEAGGKTAPVHPSVTDPTVVTDVKWRECPAAVVNAQGA